MTCKGLDNFICIERNIGPLRNAKLFCALCNAENKIVETVEIIRPVKCRYAKYTGKAFTGCKTCNGELIECQHEKQWPKKRNSKACNSECKFFETL